MPVFNAPIQLPSEKGYSPFIVVPADVYAKFEGKKPFRVVVTINKSTRWKAGLMSLRNGTGYITVSKRLLKENNLPLNKMLHINLERDTDKETWPIPEELTALFEIDDESFKIYQQLTDGKKRSITVFISQTKNTQSRVNRALLIAENLLRFKEKATVAQLFRKHG